MPKQKTVAEQIQPPSKIPTMTVEPTAGDSVTIQPEPAPAVPGALEEPDNAQKP